MPNKYEREIEEILRNLEQSEPKANLGQRVSGRLRRKAGQSMHARRRLSLPRFGVTEWFLVIAWLAAIIAGGWTFAHYEATVVTGSIAVVGAVCLLLVIITPFVTRSRLPGQTYRYGNVTPIRRNPLGALSTRWNLFLLKLRYRRRRDH
jgi:hypothetical protein